MSRPLLRAAFFVALLAGVLGTAAPALGDDTPFSVRYAQTMRGSIEAVGNQLLTCPAAAAGCLNARNRTGATGTMNNNYNMGYVDVDGDGTTVNSSTATLALPAGATVVWAGLYWGADTAAGTGGSAAPDAAARGTVKFKVGSGAYQNVTAAGADVLTSTGVATRYRAFADVSSLVAGNATYTVADVQTGRGDDRYAGWALLVAYEDAAQDVHRVSVYDGLGTVQNGTAFSTNIAPFFTPSTGTVDTRVGMLAFEGDAGIAVGESQTFNGSSLVDAQNPVDNPLNSTASINGTAFTARNPSHPNLMGTDIDVSDRTGLLAHNQGSAVLSYASGQDLFVPSALWLISDEGPAVNSSGPSIGGLARDGSTLTANPGSWNGTPTITYEYQWQRCDAAGANCVDIPGATGETYTLGPADVGSTIRVVVTAVNDAGSSTPATSAATGTVAQLAPSNVTVPAVSGTLEDGQTLTTTIGGWNGTAPLDYDVQWQRCDSAGANCADIAGATAWSYVLTAADVGATIRSEVTASNDAGSATAHSVPSIEVDPAPPVNTVVPAVSGVARDGQTLTAGTGTWTGTDPLSYAYQWQRCDADGSNCAPIAGETGSTYELTGDDIGHAVRVQVTATNVAGNAAASSAPTAAVIPAPPVNTAVPTLSGTAEDGSTLTLDDGTWSGTDPLAFDIVWQRCDAAGDNCVAIPGETGTSYTLTPDDIDATIRALVTASNVAGVAAASTAPTDVVLAAPPAVTIDPAVIGTAVDGATVTADPGVWSGTAPVDFTYQWLRCDLDGTNCADIGGATGDEYTLTSDDAGHGIRVEVTGTNAAGSATGTSPVAAVSALAPQNTALPAISGSRVDGSTLSAADGTWTGTTPLSYDHQWLRCDADGSNCVAIPGATDDEYTLTTDDVGHDVRVSVTATNVAGTAQATSAPGAGGAVEADPPANTAVPTVSGTLEDGSTLSAGNGSWSGTLPIVFTYQWQRCDADGSNCQDIAGATSDTYTLTSGDVGGAVRVEVTGTNAAGDDVAASAPTATVEAAPPVAGTPPSITGTTVDGQTLTAGTGSFSGTGPFDFDHQWQRCDADGTDCVSIAGETGTNYTLVSADVGAAIVVVVTATNDAGSATSTSAATGEVLPLAPANVTPPSISGDPVDGETLTADPGTWTGTDPIDFGYQWQRCDADGSNCADIVGADDETYTVVPGDIDHVIQVVVTASNDAGSVQSGSTQTPTAEAAPPVNTVVPAVSGTLEDGSTLTATTGDWDGTAPLDFDYQWVRCELDNSGCEDIAAATGSTYDLTAADVGHRIHVEVTASNDAGEATAASAPSAGVGIEPPAATVDPEVTGTLVDGQTLTADPGEWTGTGPIDFDYQWQRCDAAGNNCDDIDGATEETYTLGGGDVGSTVRVVVTGDNGEQTSAPSPAVGPVAPAPPASVTVPTVSGTAGAGNTLTAGDGTWSGTAPIDFDHQWQRCDADGTNCADIAGATDDTYDLTDDDVGHAIVVVVSASNAAGDDSATSAPTTAVLPAPPVNTTQPPAPTGTVVDGGTLTADPGTWTGDNPIDYTYQWQRCDADGSDCEDIDGATGDEYTLTDDDAGHAIVVVVTATNPGGSTSEASAPTVPVAAAPPANATPPSVSGTPEDGATLTADPGTWTGTTPIDHEYQWQRCDADGTNCVDIAGATDDTYTLGPDDIGDAITVVVTAVNDGGQSSEAAGATPVVVAAPPRDTVAPAITGDVELGDTLTADTGTWTGTQPVDFTNQWQRCDAGGDACEDIAGATDETYTLTEDDQGHTVVVVVTATNDAGEDTATSASSALLPAPPVNTVAPSIDGVPEVGEELTADPGEWDGTGPFTYEYQWQRCDFFGDNCVDIAGATGDTYTLTGDDLGHTIMILVTATNAADSASADAPTSPAVEEPTPTPTPTPTPSPNPGGNGSGGGNTPTGPVAGDSAFGGLGGSDLGNVPGSLVGDASCQQLAGNSKYSRVKAKGIGTIRVRAYATGPATKVSPVLVTTQISGGKAKKVTYKLDGKPLKAKRGKTWRAAITPQKLAKVGIHTLKATVKGRKKKTKAKVVTLKLKTVPCKTLFTAQRWKTTAGAGLRLRIDARSALTGVAFKVAKPLLPRQVKRPRTIGFMRVFIAGQSGRRRYSLKLGKKGKKSALVAGNGKPTVKLAGGGLAVSGLPERTAVVELTLYRTKKLDGATKRRVYKLRARVAPAGGTLSVRPKAPR